jgi:hypothetical protein
MSTSGLATMGSGSNDELPPRTSLANDSLPAGIPQEAVKRVIPNGSKRKSLTSAIVL